MLCRYIAFQLILGAAVALVLAELVSPSAHLNARDKQVDISETDADSDAYLGAQDISADIPEWLRRLPAVEEAERVVRSRR